MVHFKLLTEVEMMEISLQLSGDGFRFFVHISAAVQQTMIDEEGEDRDCVLRLSGRKSPAGSPPTEK